VDLAKVVAVIGGRQAALSGACYVGGQDVIIIVDRRFSRALCERDDQCSAAAMNS